MNDYIVDLLIWYLGDYGAITIVLILAAIPFLQTQRTTYLNNKLKRSDYVIQSYREFMNDKVMIDLYYRIDYNTFEKDQLYFGTDDEKALDRLLGHFNSIGRLFREKILTMKDADYISYQTLRIYQHEAVKFYLKELKEYNQNHRTFDDFEWFAQAVEKRMKKSRFGRESLSKQVLSEKFQKSSAETAVASV